MLNFSICCRLCSASNDTACIPRIPKMTTPEMFSDHHRFPRVNPISTPKKVLSLMADWFLFVTGSLLAATLFWSLWSLAGPHQSFHALLTTRSKTTGGTSTDGNGIDGKMSYNPTAPTFYDDRNLSYSIEDPVKDWDAKRREWLRLHPSFAAAGGAGDRVIVVTGSQPSSCPNQGGDHLLLRMFKNKVDYCRIHGYDIFFNNLLLHPKMTGFWAKYPAVRAAMLAHPEAEWIWWVDSDAVFTDMEFKVPLHKYGDYNLVVNGWPSLVYENRSWVGLNAGVFLIRNCQWSMDFLQEWSSMGPQTPNYQKWGEIQRSTLKDKMFPEADDQSGLVYLLLNQKEKWGNKVYLEYEYDLQRYWVDVVGEFDSIAVGYMDLAREVPGLRRRHAEKVSELFGALREQYLKGKSLKRSPLITHFTGCEPCTGDHNPAYTWESCLNGMQMALNFADNQVLRNYGFVHPKLLDSLTVSPVPLDLVY